MYRCRNRDAPRIRAAVKLLSPSLAASAEVRRRFVREAELLFRLDHPNIVKVRNVRMDHDPPFIEMVYVDGQTLTAVRARARLTIPQICALAAPLLRAVQYLHGSGVQHRDIKPDNVIVRGLTPTLVDFGLAAEDHNATLARPGALMGTVSYVPPEWGGPLAPRGGLGPYFRAPLGVRGQPPSLIRTAVLEQLMDMSRRKQAVPFLDPGPRSPAAPGAREGADGAGARRGLDLQAEADALDALGAQLAAAGQAEPIAEASQGRRRQRRDTTTYADGFGGRAPTPTPSGRPPRADLAEPADPLAGAGSDPHPGPRGGAVVGGDLAARCSGAFAPACWAGGGGAGGRSALAVGRGRCRAAPAASVAPSRRAWRSARARRPGLPVAFTLDGEAFDPETPPELARAPALRARVGDGCGRRRAPAGTPPRSSRPCGSGRTPRPTCR